MCKGSTYAEQAACDRDYNGIKGPGADWLLPKIQKVKYNAIWIRHYDVGRANLPYVNTHTQAHCNPSRPDHLSERLAEAIWGPWHNFIKNPPHKGTMALQEFVAYLDHYDMIDASKIQKDDDDGLDNRLKLHKYTYLAKSFGLDLGYNYNVHLYGPYSEQLSEEHADMDMENLDGTHAPPGLDCDGFLRAFKGKDADWLEIASSMLYEKEFEGGIDLERVYALKCDHEPAFIDSVYADLESLSLLSN